MEEQNIEVDENDKRIGLRPKSDFHTGKYIHRSSHLLLFNSKNEILIQKRAPDKKWYPNLFTCAVSGAVADETYEECIKKETPEEIGIKVEVKYLFKYPFYNKIDKAYHAIFLGKSDEEIKPDKREITEVKWITPKNLKKDIEENPKIYTPPFIEGMKIYFEKFYKPTE